MQPFRRSFFSDNQTFPSSRRPSLTYHKNYKSSSTFASPAPIRRWTLFRLVHAEKVRMAKILDTYEKQAYLSLNKDQAWHIRFPGTINGKYPLCVAKSTFHSEAQLSVNEIIEESFLSALPHYSSAEWYGFRREINIWFVFIENAKLSQNFLRNLLGNEAAAHVRTYSRTLLMIIQTDNCPLPSTKVAWSSSSSSSSPAPLH